MSKQYRLERVQLGDAWDSFARSSPDATVFVLAAFLASTGSRLGLYHCYNANELRAAVALVESADGTDAIADDLVIYSGILFGPPTAGQNATQQISERFEISTFIASDLAARYRNISFALAPSIIDIRPFLWFNYGQDKNRYQIDVRYTSCLNIADFADARGLEHVAAYAAATGARRQQIRYARRDGVFTEEFTDVSLLLDFYRQTMARQGELVASETLNRMKNLVSELLRAGMARMFVSRLSDGTAGSIAVYAHDQNRAYYLFGANDPRVRDSSTGTAVLWDAFGKLAQAGVREIDLEGVNSPRRGWFKLSFGGRLVPYFQVSLGRDEGSVSST